jgi:hypothetical protein
MQEYFSSHTLLIQLLSNADENIRLYATMAISNLARTESNCITLLDAGVLPAIVRQCREANFQAQHLAASTIRNLAIPRMIKSSNHPNILRD